MGKVDTEKAVDLKIKHKLSYRQIGKIQGVSGQGIQKSIKDLLPTDATKIYQDNKADIFDHAQMRLLSQLTDTKLKKTSVSQAVLAMGILYDKAQLERGRPTQNVAVLIDILDQIRGGK